MRRSRVVLRLPASVWAFLRPLQRPGGGRAALRARSRGYRLNDSVLARARKGRRWWWAVPALELLRWTSCGCRVYGEAISRPRPNRRPPRTDHDHGFTTPPTSGPTAGPIIVRPMLGIGRDCAGHHAFQAWSVARTFPSAQPRITQTEEGRDGRAVGRAAGGSARLCVCYASGGLRAPRRMKRRTREIRHRARHRLAPRGRAPSPVDNAGGTRLMCTQGWAGGKSYQCQPWAVIHSFVHSMSRCAPSST